MMYGPGKYDDLCTAAREGAKAQGAILIIIEGERGDGCSAQLPSDDAARLPAMLHRIADEIEREREANINRRA